MKRALLGEANTANNTFVSGWVVVAMPGDIIVDGTIDIYDLVAVATWFGSDVPPAPTNCDIIGDKIIDIYDILVIATHFREARAPQVVNAT